MAKLVQTLDRRHTTMLTLEWWTLTSSWWLRVCFPLLASCPGKAPLYPRSCNLPWRGFTQRTTLALMPSMLPGSLRCEGFYCLDCFGFFVYRRF